jgi:hypothetical protein
MPTRNDSQTAKAPRRSHRPANDKRPGPVFHVVHVQPEQRSEAELAIPRLQSLSARLVRVTPVLASIARAQSIWIIDGRLGKEWERLARMADELLEQIQMQLV